MHMKKTRLNQNAVSPSRNFQDSSNGGKYSEFPLNQNNLEPSQNSLKNPMTSRKFVNAGRMVLNQPQMKQLSSIKNVSSQQRPRPTTTVHSEVVHLISACVQGKAISIKSGTSKMSQVPRNNEQQKFISPPSFQMFAMDDKTYKTTQFQGPNAFVPHVFPSQLNSHAPKRSSIQIIAKAAKTSGDNSKEFQPIHTIHPYQQQYQHLATQPHNQKYPTQPQIPGHLLKKSQINHNNNEQDSAEDLKGNAQQIHIIEGSQHKQEGEGEEGVEMTLDQYFKVPSSSLPEEAQKLLLFSSEHDDSHNQSKIQQENTNGNSEEFNNQMQFLHPDLSEEGSSRAGISRGVVVFNEDNEEDFFGLGRLEELEIERFIEELKNDQRILTQDLSKCDLEDIKGNTLYAELIQELIKYVIRAADLQKDQTKSEKSASNENAPLQYFLFNGVEDCIWWRELPQDILQSVSQNVGVFRLDLVEALGRRLEKKWYLIETAEKALLAVEILVKKFLEGQCQSDSLLNSLAQAVKISQLREKVVNMIRLLGEKEEIESLKGTPKGLMLIMTLKALSADFTQILEDKGFNFEEAVGKFAGNEKIAKVFKKLKTYC